MYPSSKTVYLLFAPVSSLVQFLLLIKAGYVAYPSYKGRLPLVTRVLSLSLLTVSLRMRRWLTPFHLW